MSPSCFQGFTFSHDRLLRLPNPQAFTEPQVDAVMSRITTPTLFVLGRTGIPWDAARAHVVRAAFLNHDHLLL